MQVKPFPIQEKILRNTKYDIIGAFAGKRGGKTEVGAIKKVLDSYEQPNYDPDDIDEYQMAIIAPTYDMLMRVTVAKFLAYLKPFQTEVTLSKKKIIVAGQYNETVVHLISADKPQRLEGLKVRGGIWIDEVFQTKEQIFTEALARCSDTSAKLLVTGSLGTQYKNPKLHYIYKYFFENPLENSKAYQWPTIENPYFPKENLAKLKRTLDPETFAQLFTIQWDAPSSAAIWKLTADNLIKNYKIRPELKTSISIDWGWNHPMSVGFFQYDKKENIVYQFDEILESKMRLNKLWTKIQDKLKIHKIKRVDSWTCDAAGNQTREQSGISNIKWFRINKNINFKYRRTAISYGIPIVRTFIKDGNEIVRFKIDETKCKKTIDGIKNWLYIEKDGQLTDKPMEEGDDAPDMVRYYFVNEHDIFKNKTVTQNFDRFTLRGL